MKLIKWIISFISGGLKSNITVYAAQAAFYLVLSSIPFTMIVVSAAQFFIPIDKADVLSVLPHALSPGLKSFLTEITEEIFQKPHVPLISVSAVTTLWSASRGFAATERGIKAIYGIPKRRLFITNVLLSLIYTVAFTAVLVISLALTVFGKTILRLINSHLPWLTVNVSVFEYILFFLFVFLFFTVVYAGLSDRKIPFRYHMPGALFTLSGWILFSWAFSVYINSFANYSRIYGSLTAIVLLMLWIYACMIILLFGAKINMEIISAKKGLIYK